MSTKLEDLSVSDLEENKDYQREDNYYDEENYSEEYEDKENFDDMSTVKVEQQPYDTVYKFFYEKIKDPMIVTFLVIVFTNKYLLEFLHSISFLHIVENSIGINVMMAILIGILFLIMREFV